MVNASVYGGCGGWLISNPFDIYGMRIILTGQPFNYTLSKQCETTTLDLLATKRFMLT